MPDYKIGEKVKVRLFSGRIYQGIVEKDDGGSRVVVMIDGKKKILRRENLFKPRKLDGGAIVNRGSVALYDEANFISLPKSKPDRDSDYLKFIRSKSCCSCHSKQSEPHHWAPKGRGGRMGSKCSDYRTVPLCRKCHDYFHSTGAVPTESIVGTRQLFANCQLDNLIEWTRRKDEKE